MRYYIYKLTFKSGATYIGSHIEHSENDGYVTSSSYYKKNLETDPLIKREELVQLQDRETMNIMETICILSDKANSENNVNYNLGAWKFGIILSKEQLDAIVDKNRNNPNWRKNLSKSLKGKPFTEKHKKALSDSWHKSEEYYKDRCSKCKGNTNSRTKEEKEKISKTLKERFSNKENHPFYGKHHTEETKQKISESKAGKTPWNKGLKTPGVGGHKKGYKASEKEIENKKAAAVRVLVNDKNEIVCKGSENIILFLGELYEGRSLSKFIKNHPELGYQLMTISSYLKIKRC